MKQIETLISSNKRICICIDGRCGAGKSTLADELVKKYGGAVVRMDHFFLPPHLRGKDRINVHYERFEEEVANKLKSEMPFSYRVFDCKTMDFAQSVEIPNTQLIIVEGAYGMLPQFEGLYDYKIFADVSKEEQKRRIINRNGKEGYEVFKSRWIPLEEKYFEEYSVRKRCDYIFLSEKKMLHNKQI